MNWLEKKETSNTSYDVSVDYQKTYGDKLFFYQKRAGATVDRNKYGSISLSDILYIKYSFNEYDYFFHLPFFLDRKGDSDTSNSIHQQGQKTLASMIYSLLNDTLCAAVDPALNGDKIRPDVELTILNITNLAVDLTAIKQEGLIGLEEKYALDVESLDEERKFLLAEFFYKKTHSPLRLHATAVLLEEETILKKLVEIEQTTNSTSRQSERNIIKKNLQASLNLKKEKLKDASIINLFHYLGSLNIERLINFKIQQLEKVEVSILNSFDIETFMKLNSQAIKKNEKEQVETIKNFVSILNTIEKADKACKNIANDLTYIENQSDFQKRLYIIYDRINKMQEHVEALTFKNRLPEF